MVSDVHKDDSSIEYDDCSVENDDLDHRWNRIEPDDAATTWIPARSGLDYANFVTGFLKQEPQWFKDLWAGLQRYFEKRPVTLVHGDCRLGNMFFVPAADGLSKDEGPAVRRLVHNASKLESAVDGAFELGAQVPAAATRTLRSATGVSHRGRSGPAEEEVIFSDWEAVNVGPALWDLAYLLTLSQATEHRRARTPALLAAYAAALRANGVPE